MLFIVFMYYICCLYVIYCVDVLYLLFICYLLCLCTIFLNVFLMYLIQISPPDGRKLEGANKFYCFLFYFLSFSIVFYFFFNGGGENWRDEN